jgi:hypothetical protein
MNEEKEKRIVLTRAEKRARSEDQRKAMYRQAIHDMRQKHAIIMKMSQNKVLRLQVKAAWRNFMQSDGKLLQSDGGRFWFIRRQDLGGV